MLNEAREVMNMQQSPEHNNLEKLHILRCFALSNFNWNKISDVAVNYYDQLFSW